MRVLAAGLLSTVRVPPTTASRVLCNASPCPELLLEPEEPKWTEGARKLARLMRDVWTAKNERGQLQFKSFYFSASEVSRR